MHVKVISEFQDIHTREMRVVGVEMEVDEARGADLVKRGLAKEVVIAKVQTPATEKASEAPTEPTAEETSEAETAEVETPKKKGK